MAPISYAFIYYREKQPEDHGIMAEIDGYLNLFGLMKQCFLNFKNQKYM